MAGHGTGHALESLVEPLYQRWIDACILKRPSHRRAPLIRSARSDGEPAVERHHAFAGIIVEPGPRPTAPADKEARKRRAHRREIRSVHGAKRCECRFAVHEVVKTIDDTCDAVSSAKQLERRKRRSSVCHGLTPSIKMPAGPVPISCEPSKPRGRQPSTAARRETGPVRAAAECRLPRPHRTAHCATSACARLPADGRGASAPSGLAEGRGAAGQTAWLNCPLLNARKLSKHDAIIRA